MSRDNFRGRIAIELSDLIEVPVPQAARAVTATLKSIARALHRGEKVEIGGLGTFRVTQRPKMNASRPFSMVHLPTPACKLVKFRPSKDLLEALNSKETL